MLRRSATWLTVLLIACEGPTGPQGPRGPAGPAATSPDAGGVTPPVTAACAKDCPTAGLTVALSVSAPGNGSFFVAGEKPVLTIQLKNQGGDLLAPAALSTANLYVAGPREPEDTKAAVKLMNATVDRTAADRQHHTIYLATPKYADPAQQNLKTDADGTMRFTMGAVSDEAPGTYTAGVWVVSPDLVDQYFAVADFQIGTATAETYVSGAPDKATCLNCHKGALSGKNYMAHILPGFSPFGNYALDSLPVADCKLCHNNDGYSPNPIVRKVHGAHRGENMTNPGVAHPEYGLAAKDATLAEFANVAYPAFPNGEKDCTSCHTDDRWKTEPSRMACGTCHDNVFFDTGTLNPPRRLNACKTDSDCSGELASCNTTSGFCERSAHPIQNDDSQCVSCHPSGSDGLAPVAVVHAIAQRTATRHLQMTDVSLAGASGPNGAFMVGDTMTVNFKLVDGSGTPVTDLKTNTNLTSTAIVAGPSEAPQRVIGNLSPKTSGTLTFVAATNSYTYTFAAPIPTGALLPFFGDPADQRADNPPGTYTLWLYVNETLTVNGARVRDAANAVVPFALGADAPLQPRQVITQEACNSCHVVTQAHGGTRQRADACFTCHNAGARDGGAGVKGAACTTDSQCVGFAAGWQTCQDTNSDGTPDACVSTKDPTPGTVVDFRAFVHDIHFNRLREGYAERNNLDGVLEVTGGTSAPSPIGEILLPQDVRNCTKCHADTNAKCSATAPCGYGQSCVSGTCKNTAWTDTPSAVACLSCHDAADAYGHAAIMTYTAPEGDKVETCAVCHGPGADFSVDKVHNISNPYVPPYPRTRE